MTDTTARPARTCEYPIVSSCAYYAGDHLPEGDTQLHGDR